MAFYAKTTGIDGYRFAKAKGNCICFICKDDIQKGDQRYVKSKLNLCVACKHAWYKEGGMLGTISRFISKK